MALRSIPASQIVSVIPSVMSAGGSPLSFNGVFLTKNANVPIGEVLPFSSASSVAGFFGETSKEYQAASIYFQGFDGSHIKPGQIFFYKYNTADAAAFLRGASVADMKLADLQAVSGELSVLIDGKAVTASSVDLSAATSFSAAAESLATALKAKVTFDTQLQAFIITSGTSGKSSTIDYATGDAAKALKLTQETGAVSSQGAGADTPAGVMNNVTKSTQNWVTFTYLEEPTIDVKLEFADWVTKTTDRYAYIAWDSDAAATISGNTTCFGAVAKSRAYDGVIPMYCGLDKAAFLIGAIASIDWTQTNGRITLKFKKQAGLEADITDETVAENLTNNGYNFYGAWATANDRFIFLANGSMVGEWDWIDTYVNQVRLNSQFQLALMTLLTSAKSVPYNAEGIALQRAACDDVIKEAVNFGSIRAGVTLSEQQKALINTETGKGIDAPTQIEQVGYYLLIQQASAQVRGQRGSMPMTFWYADGGSVHSINLGSVAIQ
jgi:hypothetical protein